MTRIHGTLLGRLSLLLISFAFLGAGSIPNGRAIPNSQPDIEDQDPFHEEGGLESSLDQTPPNSSNYLSEDPFDITQGSVDQAQGFYSHGTLMNASEFDLEGDGFIKIFRPRMRGFATYDMTEVVAIAASQLAQDYRNGERIQIGDVCAEHGGQLAEHISHQNGLDADIAYLRMNHHEQDPDVITGFEEIFVQNGKITANYDLERNWTFVKNIYATGRLVRIFMDPVIKAAICEYTQQIGENESGAEVLRRIRPLANHQDHMHIRITCPQKSPNCVAQALPPEGTGCDEVMPQPQPAPTSLM